MSLTHLVEIVCAEDHGQDDRIDGPVTLHDKGACNEQTSGNVDIVELQLGEVVRQGLVLRHLEC